MVDQVSPGVRAHLVRGVAGLLLGVALARTGVTDYDELHRMFILADPRLFLVFAGAVLLIAVGLLLLLRDPALPKKGIHRGTVPGGALFGLGAVLAGGCPAISLAQLGQGYVFALLAVAGIALGTWLYPKAHARFFRWDRAGCDEDR